MSGPGKKKIEICVANIQSAFAAEAGGASRIELCDNLWEGGTTPGMGMITAVSRNLSIDTMVMIRPRGGDFLYDDHEFGIMKDDIALCRDAGVKGVVFGILLRDGNIDLRRTKELAETAYGMDTTFHRAFDLTPEPFRATEQIIDCGIRRILTAGQQNRVPEGKELIRDLIERYGDQISIMPGSGINETNISEISDVTGALEFHLTARIARDSRMVFRKEGIFMGGLPQIPEYKIFVSDADKVRKIVTLVNVS